MQQCQRFFPSIVTKGEKFEEQKNYNTRGKYPDGIFHIYVFFFNSEDYKLWKKYCESCLLLNTV